MGIEKFGDLDILVDLSINESIKNRKESYGTSSTSGKAKKKYTESKKVIKEVVKEFAKELSDFEGVQKPKSIELEFSLGLEVSSNMWVIGGKNDYKLTVKLVW